MYAANYARNKTLIKGLRQNGVQVVECNVKAHFFWGFRYYHLLKRFLEVGTKTDIIFVGFPGQTDVPLAWILGKIFHKKVVFDAFISLYNSLVFDRKNFGEKNWRAKFWWFIDWLSCSLADRVILDTNEHIKYFVRTFRLPKKKFIRVLVGTDTDIFFPRKVKPHQGFHVGFHGSYLPLQGVDIIIETAKLLRKYKEIRFNLLGNGLERQKIEGLINKYQLNNVKLFDPVAYEKLPDFMSSNNIYLGGHFGVNVKSRMVIPNKVYEAMATEKATIVGDSNATKELFENNVQCLLVKQGDPKSLATAILKLKKSTLFREKIAIGGYNLISSYLTPKMIAVALLKDLSL